MELVILVGIPASGKSTFYRERFFDTHVRINLDMLRTRKRETKLFEACLAAGQSMVIDNTNPRPEDRRRYIPQAKAAGFRVIGYLLDSKLEACEVRNRQRPTHRVVPAAALAGILGRLTRPSFAEGFDELWQVRIDASGAFVVEAWPQAR